MKYVVVSAAVTDEIHFDDGRVKTVPGGAGIYALAGIKLWEDDVEIVTGIGTDYKELHGKWYEENALSMSGLTVKDQHSPYTIIQYFADGEREEIPKYGLEHFKKLETTAKELEPYFKQADGIYIFKNTDPTFWNEILKLERKPSGTIIWEIAADAAFPENEEKVQEIASQVEIFSINLTEASRLFGISDKNAIIKKLQSWQVELIFLRQGAKGAVMISPREIVEVPSETDVNVIDPTGGGNSSTGAVLCGAVNHYSPKVCGKMGSLSAAMCISQYGVPQKITKEMRKKAYQKAGIEG